MSLDSPFQVKIRKIQFQVIVSVLELSGELDATHTLQFKKVLYDLMEGLHPYVILNLKNLTFINSQSLGIIVKALKRFSKMKNGKLVLCQIHPNLEMLFEMINPGAPIGSFITEEGALTEFKSLTSEFL